MFYKIKQVIKLFLPPVIILYLRFLKKQAIDVNKYKLFKLRFSFVPIPGDGYLPCHVRGYEKYHRKLIKELICFNNFIIFFNIVKDTITGGMMSIDRLAYNSVKIAESFGFKVIQSGLPFSYACIKNKYYDWNVPLVDFNFIVEYLKPTKLLLNIPESFCFDFINGLTSDIYQWLSEIPDLKINILNQNDMLMPSQFNIEKLRTLSNGKISITAAHEGYYTEERARNYACPMYKLTPFLPDFYRSSFSEKHNLIVFSPDSQPALGNISAKIKLELPDYKIVIINNMHFENYKKIISEAKYVISFGEGWDGYFIEAYLSNSIGITVKNPIFFPADFKDIPTVYNSWSQLYARIIEDIKKWSSDALLYHKVHDEAESAIREYINYEKSEKDCIEFYKKVL